MKKTPDSIPGAFQLPATDNAVFGKSGPHRPLAVVQNAFIKELEGLARYNNPADVLRNWASWWAYMIAADVANTPSAGEDKLDPEQKDHLAAWRKDLAERRDNMKSVLESYGNGWRTRSANLMELMGEGLEAANGEFLSSILESGLGGTLKGNGQFFTPPSVCRMMGRMLLSKPRRGWIELVSDPCCGTGSIPIASVGAFLDAGGRREDICCEVGDIDAGALCMCYLQMVALMIPGRAQTIDTLRMEPHGPVMLTPAYVLFQIGRRLQMQETVTAMDALFRSMREKAPRSAQGASEATGGTDGGGEAENAPGSDFEAPTGHTAGAEASEPPPLHEVAAVAIPGGQRQGILPGFE